MSDETRTPGLAEPLHNGRSAPKATGPPWWRSCRYLLALMEFSGLAILFFQRTHLSVAMVCMVNHTAVERRYHALASPHLANQSSGYFSYGYAINTTDAFVNSTTTEVACSDVEEQAKEDGQFEWSRDVQGMLLSAMFWSYAVMQIPGAVFSERCVTAKTATTASIAAVSLLNFLLPVAAQLSPWAVFASRLLIGIFSAQYIVAFNQIWRKWAPPGERSRLLSLSFSGSQFANAFVFPTSALLCRTALGWPAVFYTFSCLGMGWVLLSLLLVYESPDVHPRISPEEREYITSSIGTSTSTHRKDSIPWRKILTSVPLWAISIAAFAFNWANYMLMTTLPMFMREVLKFDIKSNGFFSMLPYLAAWVVIYVSGFLSDFLIQKKIFSTVWTRKIVFCVGQVVCATCFVALSFLDCRHQGAAVALLTLAVGLASTSFASLPVNYFDLVPRFAAICLAIGNTFCVIPGFLAPVVVAHLTKEETRETWQKVYFIAAAILLIGATVFCVFGQGHLQSWAVPRGSDTTVEVALVQKQDPPPSTDHGSPVANGLKRTEQLEVMHSPRV